MKLELSYPLKPKGINQPFGNTDPKYTGLGLVGHNGIDFFATDNQSIRATHDGIVTFTGEDGAGGLGVVVRTQDKKEYNNGETFFKSIYWHLKPGTFQVKAGDIVKCGQILGGADNTGMSTGTHLHFGLKPIQQGEQDWIWYNLEHNNGYWGAIDPAPYWNGMYAEDYKTISDQLALIAKKVAELWKIIFNK